MKKYILDNGVRLIYKYKEGAHTSFCIGLEAGANKETKENIGAAHGLEHILFKGTKKYSEEFINSKLDEIFAMNNAMTNFPYAIYYGVTANDDFKDGFDLYSDIVLNPSFTEIGFKEEMSIIKEESKEWSEDLEQYCEDLLLASAFKEERINKIIIGSENNIEALTMDTLKSFYNKFYVSENMCVSVVTSLSYDDVFKIVENNFGALEKKSIQNNDFVRTEFYNGLYKESRIGTDTAKIQSIYDISKLSLKDITLLRIFNMYFGEGVSSILYDEIRTKKGFAYEVYSEVKWEKGISLFKIVINTSKTHENEVLKTLDSIEDNIGSIISKLEDKAIKILLKRYKLKLSLDIERSIVIANRSCIYEIMFRECDYIFKELEIMEVDIEYMKKLILSIFKNKAMMILE